MVLLEKELVGHGATGHNGGQVVAAFELGFEPWSRRWGRNGRSRAIGS